MADTVKGLLERQKAAVAEAERIHTLVAQEKMWKRPVETSYVELARAETNLAEEVAKLEAEFAPLPVLARVICRIDARRCDAQPAPITTRLEDIDPALAFDPELEAANDRKVLRPMSLAARRLGAIARRPQAGRSRASGQEGRRPEAAAQVGGPADPPPQGGAANRTSSPRWRS